MVSNNNNEAFNRQQYLSKYALAQGVAFSILTFDEVAHTSGHPTLKHYEVNCHHHEFLALYPPPLTLASQLPDPFFAMTL
jgi:hypothetical protein